MSLTGLYVFLNITTLAFNMHHSRGFCLKVKMLESFDPVQCSLDCVLLEEVTPIIGRNITSSI